VSEHIVGVVVRVPQSNSRNSEKTKEQNSRTMYSHKRFLFAVTLLSVTTATIALVPTSHTVRTTGQCPNVDYSKKRRRDPLIGRRSRLLAHVAPTQDELDLLSSLPAMSAEIKQQTSSGTKNNYNGRRRRRRSKQQNNKNNTNASTLKVNGATKSNEKKKPQESKKQKEQICSTEQLFDTIPKLSDILEGRTALDNEMVKEETKSENNKSEIKVIKTTPKKKKTEVASPNRVIENDAPTTEPISQIESLEQNGNKQTNMKNDNEHKIAAEPVQEQTKSTAVTTPKKTTSSSNQKVQPWRAGYKSSKRTQGRLQKAFFESTSLVQGTFSHAKLILDTLLDTPAHYCNAVNLVCALTYSAKAMGQQRVNQMETDTGYRQSLQDTFDILHDLLVVHRDEGLLTPRQLCNVVWAIAKHVDRNPSLLLSQGTDSSEYRLEETIDEIAQQLTSILFEDDSNEVVKSSFQQPKIKLGEICMACWAYGKLRHREIPPGWPAPPQMGAVKSADSLVADWKTEKLGKKRRSINAFTNSADGSDNVYGTKEMSETDRLFDAIGYALCEMSSRDEEDDAITDTGMLKDCTWSELANVGWAFASHGRCRSKESETLLKAVALEASNRLKDGIIANNSNHQHFLVRDVTQLLWALGTLQADNYKLADDLVLLVESLTANLRLGTITRSRFAQGRPLRRWSCADLVQTSVALAHARIDEKLLLEAVFEEGNYRLMEGASSTRKQSSIATLPSESNLPLGEDRRTFHPWEASILLWAQARLCLTEQEGISFDEFADDAPLFFLKALRESRGSFAESKIGPQEQANIVWSLVILEKYHSAEAIMLIDLIFAEAARSCKENKEMQLEHAHQLWQAYFMLEEDCPEAVQRVPEWFVSYLKDKWNVEKARLKVSSARHQSLSSTLQLMGVDHINEHDEDIDVAIILQPNAVWSHETDMDEDGFYEEGDDNVSVAVEFDGPNHFTRIRNDAPMERPRALGHTVLKYRLLKKQGWTVVRVPYYEFDKIPFWASMERQRYLQRKLKTHANIQFSEVDVSEYKTLTPNRKSRFD